MNAVLDEVLAPLDREQCSKNVAAALLTAEEWRAEEHSAHPIATLPEVCGCINPV